MYPLDTFIYTVFNVDIGSMWRDDEINNTVDVYKQSLNRSLCHRKCSCGPCLIIAIIDLHESFISGPVIFAEVGAKDFPADPCARASRASCAHTSHPLNPI